MAGQPVNNSTKEHPVEDKSHQAPNSPCDDERMAISPENANVHLPAGIALEYEGRYSAMFSHEV